MYRGALNSVAAFAQPQDGEVVQTVVQRYAAVLPTLNCDFDRFGLYSQVVMDDSVSTTAVVSYGRGTLQNSTRVQQRR